MRTEVHGIVYGGIAAILAGVLATLYGCGQHSSPEGLVAPPSSVAEKVAFSPEQKWTAALPYLQQAEEKSQRLIDGRIQVAQQFFNTISSKTQLEDFVDDVLSYGSKFSLVTGGNEAFNQGVAAKFEQQVVSQGQLKSLFEKLVSAYRSDLDACDNQLLLALGADADTAPGVEIDIAAIVAPIGNDFGDLYKTAQFIGANDLFGEALRQGMSLVISQCVANGVSNRMSRSGAADNTGNKVLCELVGLAVGFAADAVISRVTSPKNEMVQKLQDSLQDMRNKSVPALREYLLKMANERASVRRQVLSQAYGVQE
jgi:hypothetical protein